MRFNPKNPVDAAIFTILTGSFIAPQTVMANGPKTLNVEELNVDGDLKNVTDIILTLDENDLTATGKADWKVKGSIANRNRKYFLVSKNDGKDYVAWASIGSDGTIKRTGSIDVKNEKLGGNEVFHAAREIHGKTYHTVFDSQGTYAGTISNDVFNERYASKSMNPIERLFSEVETILENIADDGCKVNRNDKKKLEEAVRISTGRRFRYSGLKVVGERKARKVLTDDEIKRYSLPDSNNVCVVKVRQVKGDKVDLWLDTTHAHGIDALLKEGYVNDRSAGEAVLALSHQLNYGSALDRDNIVGVRNRHGPGFQTWLYATDEFAKNPTKAANMYRQIRAALKDISVGQKHKLATLNKYGPLRYAQDVNGRELDQANLQVARQDAHLLLQEKKGQKDEQVFPLPLFGPHNAEKKPEIDYNVVAIYSEEGEEETEHHVQQDGTIRIKQDIPFRIEVRTSDADAKKYPGLEYLVDVRSLKGSEIGDDVLEGGNDHNKEVTVGEEHQNPYVDIDALLNRTIVDGTNKKVVLRIDRPSVSEELETEIMWKDRIVEVIKNPDKPHEFSKNQPFVNMIPSTGSWVSAYLDALYAISHPGALTGQGGMNDAAHFLEDGSANRHMLNGNAIIRGRRPFGNVNLGLDIVGGINTDFGKMSQVDNYGNVTTFDGDYMDMIRGNVGGGLVLEAPNLKGVDLLFAAHAGPIFSKINYDLAADARRELTLIGEGEGKGFFVDAGFKMAYLAFAADLKFGFTRNTDEIAVQRLLRGRPLLNPDGSDHTDLTRIQDNFRIDADARYLFVDDFFGPYFGASFERENVTSMGPDGRELFSEENGLMQIRPGLELDVHKNFAARLFYGYEFMNDQHSIGLQLWTLDRMLSLYSGVNFDPGLGLSATPGGATRTALPTIYVGVQGTFDILPSNDYRSDMEEAEAEYQTQEDQHQADTADQGHGIVCNTDGQENMCGHETMPECNTLYEDSCRFASEEDKKRLSGDIITDKAIIDKSIIFGEGGPSTE